MAKSLLAVATFALLATLLYSYTMVPSEPARPLQALLPMLGDDGEEPCPCHGDKPLPEPNPLPADRMAAASVDYHTDVRPIIDAHCLTCHREGAVAPFPFEDYEQVASYALAISDAVEQRRMPPFLADNSGACQTFRDARWLSDQEIATINSWVADDFPEGPAPATAAEAPVVPEPDFDPDLSIDFAGDYIPKPGEDRPDSFRCFPIRTDLAADRYVTGFHIEPGNVGVVHHVNIWAIDSEDGAASMFEAAREDEGPGFSCYTRRRPPLRWVAGWAPGAEPVRWSDGAGVPLQADQTLLMEVHYFGAGEPEVSQLHLETTAGPRTEVQFISVNAARDFLLPPGEDEVRVSQSFYYDDLRKGFTLLGVAPHMHTHGRTLRLDIAHDEEETCLVDVDRWDFHRQQAYFYEEPLHFGASDGREVTIECTFDTTDATEPISYGMNTENEMCQALLAFTIDGDAREHEY